MRDLQGFCNIYDKSPLHRLTMQRGETEKRTRFSLEILYLSFIHIAENLMPNHTDESLMPIYMDRNDYW